MQKNISFLGAALLVAVLVSGCAGPSQKLGRGMSNLLRTRFGSRRCSGASSNRPFTIRHTPAPRPGSFAVWARRSPASALAFYEIVTAPFPNHKDDDYGPVATNYLTPKPAYPDSYHPGLPLSSIFATDTSFGFSGGEIAPYIPGSRFRVFDSP